MTQYSNFVKNNIKAGKTLYIVQAFPAENRAQLITLRVIARPFKTLIAGTYYTHMFKALRHYEGLSKECKPQIEATSLLDTHLLPGNRYNFHRAFTSKKKAQAYADMVKAGVNVCSMFGYRPNELEAYLIKSIERTRARNELFPNDLCLATEGY